MPEPFDTKLFMKNYFDHKIAEPQRIYAKGWTPERCQQARERCLRNKPWRFSTGAKTLEGKHKVSMNALKNGEHSQAMKYVNDTLREIKSGKLNSN